MADYVVKRRVVFADREFRVTVQRAGCAPKVKRLRSRRGLRRYLTLLGPRPWEAFGKTPEAYACCSGWECGCGGRTMREDAETRRANLPALESVRVESREVTRAPWQTFEAPEIEEAVRG